MHDKQSCTYQSAAARSPFRTVSCLICNDCADDGEIGATPESIANAVFTLGEHHQSGVCTWQGDVRALLNVWSGSETSS